MASKTALLKPAETGQAGVFKVPGKNVLFYTDPDFVEHLEEAGYDGVIPAFDLIEEYSIWEKENTEPTDFKINWDFKEGKE